MESLYVCLFSNGHIKVGQSTDPDSRIASHAERVACIGVELVNKYVVACVGPSRPRELQLINQCIEVATSRFQNEWFTGLDFSLVCRWAENAANLDAENVHNEGDTFAKRLRKARLAAGLTQAELALGMGTDGRDLQKAAVSTWEIGNNFPNVQQLRLICERLCVTADSLIFGPA